MLARPLKLLLSIILLTGNSLCYAATSKNLSAQGLDPLAFMLPINQNKTSAQRLPAASPGLNGQKSSMLDALKYKLPVRVWAAKRLPVKGIVVAVHGMTQHSGTFAKFAAQLNNKGFTFVALDMRGHGLWYHSQAWSPKGKQCDYNESTKDLEKLLAQVRARYPSLPVYCLGESIGSAVAIHAAYYRPDLVDGLILVSAGTKPRFYSVGLVASDVVHGLCDLHGQMDVTGYIMRYSSNDKRICLGMVQDPLSRQTLTPVEILKARFFLAGTPHYAKHLSPNIPVMLLTGGQDGIVSPGSVRSMCRQMKANDKELVYLPECGHVLLGTDFLSDRVVGAISTWLNREVQMAKENKVPEPALLATNHEPL